MPKVILLDCATLVDKEKNYCKISLQVTYRSLPLILCVPVHTSLLHVPCQLQVDVKTKIIVVVIWKADISSISPLFKQCHFMLHRKELSACTDKPTGHFKSLSYK